MSTFSEGSETDQGGHLACYHQAGICTCNDYDGLYYDRGLHKYCWSEAIQGFVSNFLKLFDARSER